MKLKKSTLDSNRPAVIRTYIKRYADALQLERQGMAVIVYIDEVSSKNILFFPLICLSVTRRHRQLTARTARTVIHPSESCSV